MANLTVLCRNCFAYSQYDALLAGNSVRCPKCEAIVEIPIPTATIEDVQKTSNLYKPGDRPSLLFRSIAWWKSLSTVTKSATGTVVLVLGLPFLCCSSIFFVGSLPPSARMEPGRARPIEPEMPREVMASGSVGYLWSPGKPLVMVPKTEAALQEIIRMENANNHAGIGQLIESGRAFYVPADTPITIVESGFLTHKIRVMNGIARGMIGFVPVELVHPTKQDR